MSGIGRGGLRLVAGMAASFLIAALELRAEPHLVKDINPGSASGIDFFGPTYDGCCIADEVAAVGNTLFFAANDGVHGLELWKTNGTEAGTVLVSDINPGPDSSSPRNLIAVGNALFFRAWDPVHGYELRKSDGTAAGTVLVKDIKPGPDGGLAASGKAPVAMGNRLFFVARLPGQGNSLWVSDGTEAGTVQLMAVDQGLWDLCPFAGAVYFGTSSGGGEGALWKTDGTEAGTVLVKNLYPAGGAYNLTVFDGMLYFTTDSGAFPDLSGLWKTDGTAAGTSLVWPGSNWGPLSIANGRLFFSPWPYYPYVSDGTMAGTKLLEDRAGTQGPFVGLLGNTFFAASPGLWKSDGTPAGTRQFVQTCGGPCYGSTLTCTGCALYFMGGGGFAASGVWTSDGTPEGTLQRVLAIGGTPVIHVGSTLYFQSDDPNPISQFGRELWALNVDEPFVSFAAATSTAAEDAGVHTITVRLTTPCGAASTADVSVGYKTVNGNAYYGIDYVAASGTLTFPAGSRGGSILTIPVTILNNPTRTDPREFRVLLSGPFALGDQHAVTITDSLPQPSLAIGDVAMPEGSEGLTAFPFPVTLSSASSSVVSVHYATAEGSAQAGLDFIPASGTLVFPPGSTTQTITVFVIGDRAFEVPERFAVNLSDAVNATIAGAQGQATTLNDDSAGLSIADLAVVRPATGTTSATFAVTLSPAASSPVTVQYSTAPGTATPGSDYEDTSGSLEFGPGVSTLPIDVVVHAEALAGGVKTFAVNLANPTGAAIVHGQAVGSIYDPGQYPALSVSDLTIIEPPRGSRNATFTVTLSPTSGGPVAVRYSTAPGTATPGSDYEDTSGWLAFAPGESTLPADVLVHSDDLNEGVETLEVNLGNATGAAITNGQAIGSIYDSAYFTVTPCRVMDTRNPVGPLGGPAIAARRSRIVTLAGVCGIPATAIAVSVNITVTQPTTAGGLCLYRADIPLPPVSTLSYVRGQTVANNAVVGLSPTGALAIRCSQASGTAHVIIDVNGYFE